MGTITFPARFVFTNRLEQFTLAFILLFVLAEFNFAQNPPSPKRGFQPGGSYALSDIETINTTNGNMLFRIPVGSLPPGRGITAGVTLLYQSKLYDSYTTWIQDSGRPCSWDPDHPEQCSYYQNVNLNVSNSGGWRYGLWYYTDLIDRTSDGSIHPRERCDPIYDRDGYYDLTYRYKFKIIFPDGSSHEMRPNGFTDGNPNDPQRDFYNVLPNGWISDCLGNGHWHSNTTMSYYSTDASYLRLDIQRSGEWTLYLPDGTRVVSSMSNPQRIYDRNNNYVQIDNVEDYQGTGPATRVVDEMGRNVAIGYDTATNEDLIRVQGFGQELVTRVSWKTD